MKSQTILLTAAAGLLLATVSQAQTLTDIGTTTPTPGANDISQLLSSFTVPSSSDPAGLNYYWDDGANHPTAPGGYAAQSFTTLSNPNGYVLNSVAIKTLGNGGSTPTQKQSFTLSLYELSGDGLTNATLVDSFVATGQLLTEGDWMLWSNLTALLYPGTNYAFGFGRSPGSPGDWENISTATGLPYGGGQSCLVPVAGGLVTYSTTPNDYDMTFDLGITPATVPVASAPTASIADYPPSANVTLLAGTNVTLTAAAVSVTTPITYQWQTDGGTGGAMTNVGGATSTNLAVSTAGWAPGVYKYDFVAANSYGPSTSAVLTITITTVAMVDTGTTNAPTPGANDISQLSSAPQGNDGLNYYSNNGNPPGQSFTTGPNAGGYVLSSLAFKTAAGGSAFGDIQPYVLRIYSLPAPPYTNATLIATYNGYGGGIQSDWFEWVGLNTALAANSHYAYTIGLGTGGTGYEQLANASNNPYAGGGICTIPTAGGQVTYGTVGASDATFDLGLQLSTAPVANSPTASPSASAVTGELITLSASAAGSLPISYQWQTDGGTGGALTSINGATGSNLVVNTGALAGQGSYQYDFIATNSFGTSTSSVIVITVTNFIVSPPTETPTTANIAVFYGTNVTLGAAIIGTPPLYYQWQTDGGSGGTLTNIPAATSSNLTPNSTGFPLGPYQYDVVVSNTYGSVTSSVVTTFITNVIMADLGTNSAGPIAPTPGPTDITQLTFVPGFYTPGGLNYYTDDGAGHGAWAGQTFTTGSNSGGYLMTSLAWKSDGNGNSFGDFQLYDLYIYSLSNGGATATQIASYQGYGGGLEQDWFQWLGLNVALEPNTMYAYAFGRDNSSTGWEDISSATNNPYGGGQVCTIPAPAGGTVTYGATGNFDATFDIGVSVAQAPFASLPTYTPNVTPVYAGTAVTLAEQAVGASPLSYQWLADNGTGTLSVASGDTSSNLVVNTTSLAPGNYEYAVVVTNSHGASTSAVLTLNITGASDPQIVNDITPSPNEGYVGQTVSFTATFTGTLPISYQWMVNTGTGATPISGAGNPSALTPTLVLTNLQLTNAGTYSLTAANSVPGGPVSSSPSVLTVLADLAPPASGTYGAVVLSNDPVAYWQLNETGDTSTGVLPAYDATGHNFDGVYGAYAVDGVAGPQPPTFPGFPANNTAVQSQNAATVPTYVTVPSLNLNTNTVTITMWINPESTEAANNGLFMYRNANNTDAAGLGFGSTVVSGMAELGYVWNSNNAATFGFNSGLYPVANQWSFVALVVQPTQATIYLYYLDPNTGLPDLYSAVNPVANSNESFSLGTNLIGGDSYNVSTRTFGGDIDQVAVYNTALTEVQLLSLFGKATGLSEIAASIAEQPQSEGVYSGGTATFSANGINGTPPLSYQWQYINPDNVTNVITGATNTSLTISNATATNAGGYQLLVKNPVGTTPSSIADLLVITPEPGSYEAAVLAYGPLAFWKLNETNSVPGTGLAYDYVNGYNGVYQAAAQNGYNGIVGPEAPQFPGFPATNWALETFEGVANSYVTASAGTLTASNLTYAMWINPSGNVVVSAGLLFDRGGAGEGLCFGTNANSSGMAELGYTWNQNNSDTWGWNTGIYPPANEWSFVAMVIEPTQASIYMMNTNGIQSAVNAIAQDTEEFGVAWHIGDDATGTAGARTFAGSISSVGVFLSALSAEQLETLYNAGTSVTLNAAKAGAGNLTLTWSAGTLLQATNLAGPWTTNAAATSPYTITTTGSQMFFKVQLP